MLIIVIAQSPLVLAVGRLVQGTVVDHHDHTHFIGQTHGSSRQAGARA